MRSFLAIELPEPLIAELTALQARLPVGRIMPEENLHLTLAFLGDQSGEALEELHFRLQRLQAPPFELALSGLDCFGGRNPRGLVIRAAKNPVLARLHQQVHGALYASGLQTARERFRPHVTLARFGRSQSETEMHKLQGFLGQWLDFSARPVLVHSFSLFRSTLGPGGAVHDILGQYSLN
jgi:RNA 2',3'-cyclic 3'-phosphodiesterase